MYYIKSEDQKKLSGCLNCLFFYFSFYEMNEEIHAISKKIINTYLKN